MENIEEYREKIKEIQKLPGCARYTEYKLIIILRLKKLFCKVLKIEEDKLPINKINLSFMSTLIDLREKFDIDNIKLDILNNVGITDIAMKYKEPEEVILEIKDKHNINTPTIIPSKIYTSNELLDFFKVSDINTIYNNKKLKKIANNSIGSRTVWYYGEDIIKNLIDIYSSFVSVDEIVLDGKEWLRCSFATKKIGIISSNLRNMIYKKSKVFGVIIKYRNVERYSRTSLYLCKEDILKSISNKKYYIKYSDIIDYDNIPKHYKIYLKKEYIKRYKKNIDFLKRYVKKETLNNYINLYKEFGYDVNKILKKG